MIIRARDLKSIARDFADALDDEGIGCLSDLIASMDRSIDAGFYGKIFFRRGGNLDERISYCAYYVLKDVVPVDLRVYTPAPFGQLLLFSKDIIPGFQVRRDPDGYGNLRQVWTVIPCFNLKEVKKELRALAA